MQKSPTNGEKTHTRKKNHVIEGCPLLQESLSFVRRWHPLRDALFGKGFPLLPRMPSVAKEEREREREGEREREKEDG